MTCFRRPHFHAPNLMQHSRCCLDGYDMKHCNHPRSFFVYVLLTFCCHCTCLHLKSKLLFDNRVGITRFGFFEKLKTNYTAACYLSDGILICPLRAAVAEPLKGLLPKKKQRKILPMDLQNAFGNVEKNIGTPYFPKFLTYHKPLRIMYNQETKHPF